MKTRPILFKGDMVRAILEGSKTQTRRIFKVTGMDGKKRQIESPHEEILQFDDGSFHYLSTGALSGPYPCPYGQPGDRLWVREAWMREPHPTEVGLTKEDIPTTWDYACANAGKIYYRADLHSEITADGRPWRSSLHMPRWASRILLEVTDVRVERLQDISEEDALAEGVSAFNESRRIAGQWSCGESAVHAFHALWQAINSPGSWEANPWVWVVSFKVVEGR